MQDQSRQRHDGRSVAFAELVSRRLWLLLHPREHPVTGIGASGHVPFGLWIVTARESSDIAVHRFSRLPVPWFLGRVVIELDSTCLALGTWEVDLTAKRGDEALEDVGLRQRFTITRGL